MGAMSSRHLGLYYIIIPSVSSPINMIIFICSVVISVLKIVDQNDRTYTIDVIQILQMFAEKVSVSAKVNIIHLNLNKEIKMLLWA